MMSVWRRLKATTSSEAKRRKSSQWAGFASVTVRFGRPICVEARVVHRPEHVAPGGVERGDVAVFCGEPAAEGGGGDGGVGVARVVAAVFVVGLPGGDMGVLPVAVGEDA